MPTPHALKNGFAGPSRIITQIGLLLLAISTAACGSSGDGGDPSGATPLGLDYDAGVSRPQRC